MATPFSVVDCQANTISIHLNRGSGNQIFSPSNYYLATLRGFVDSACGSGTFPVTRPTPEVHEEENLKEFRSWLEKHRGIRKVTIDERTRIVSRLLMDLGNEPTSYTVSSIRSGFLEHTECLLWGTVRNVAGSLRLYLQYLVARGLCEPHLVHAVPNVRSKHHTQPPRFLERADVERVIASCDRRTPTGIRDRAVLLLLARLGLRAADVMNLEFSDIDWKQAEVVVCGKGGMATKLPLPQDVGNALLSYIRGARPISSEEKVFLCNPPPFGPFKTSRTVSQIAIRAMKRAGVRCPARTGSHVFRHSLATNLLRSRFSMEAIAAILRHRSLDSTQIYAKVDTPMLLEVSQPWIGEKNEFGLHG